MFDFAIGHRKFVVCLQDTTILDEEEKIIMPSSSHFLIDQRNKIPSLDYVCLCKDFKKHKKQTYI